MFIPGENITANIIVRLSLALLHAGIAFNREVGYIFIFLITMYFHKKENICASVSEPSLTGAQARMFGAWVQQGPFNRTIPTPSSEGI